MKNTKERNVRLDFARVVMMLFVIAIHTPMEALDAIPTFRTYYYDILFSCDAGFFIISGYFLLQKKFSSKEDYKSYYFSRFVSIFVPLILFHFILDILFHRFVFQIGLTNYLESYWLNLISNDYNSYLWFLYVYIPLVIFAPFFSKMLNHMSKGELFFLVLLATAWELFEWYCSANGIAFYFGSHLIASWTIYFLLGHYLKRFADELKKFRFIFYVIGFFALRSVVKHSTGDVVPGALIGRPYYMIFIFCLFVLMLYGIPTERIKHSGKVLSFVAKHSFTVYLTHFEMIEHVKNYLNRFYDLIHFTPAIGVHNVINLICNILCSILFAFLLDELVFFRLQGLLRKLKRT